MSMRLGVLAGLVFALGCQEAARPPAHRSAPAPVTAPASAPVVVPASVASPPRPPPDWPALKAAEALCADCHPDEAASWAASPMGQSFRARSEVQPAPFAHPGEALHPGSRQRVRQAQGVVSVEPEGAPQYRQVRTISHVFGSGTHVLTSAWADGTELSQVPLSWYAEKGAWELSPGFADLPESPGFSRPITAACVACHADPVATLPGEEDRPAALPSGGFGCARCHGDARAHAAARQAGRTDAAATRPDTLAPARSLDVCAQCHFAGPARVLRAGRGWRDFLPGDALADTVAVFVRQQPDEGFRATDHAARLALSACARGTPSLTCTTCHQIHTAQADSSAPCRACHGEGGGAAGHLCTRPGDATPMGGDCVRCHLDRGLASNIPHTTGTDHFIRRRPTPATPRTNDSPLVWAARPEVAPADAEAQVLLGRAYAEAWRADRQPLDATRAVEWLERGLARRPDDAAGWLELAGLARLRGDAARAGPAAERAFALAPTRRRVVLEAAAARFTAGDPAAALAAIDQIPQDHTSEITTLRARALAGLGRTSEALGAALRATELQPMDAEAWLAVGLLATQLGDDVAGARALTAAAVWSQGIHAPVNLGLLTARHGAWAESEAAFAQAEARMRATRPGSPSPAWARPRRGCTSIAPRRPATWPRPSPPPARPSPGSRRCSAGRGWPSARPPPPGRPSKRRRAASPAIGRRGGPSPRSTGASASPPTPPRRPAGPGPEGRRRRSGRIHPGRRGISPPPGAPGALSRP
ncbi:MAG: hypothetical protein R3F60_05110 [bacterium]